MSARRGVQTWNDRELRALTDPSLPKRQLRGTTWELSAKLILAQELYEKEDIILEGFLQNFGQLRNSWRDFQIIHPSKF